MKGQNVSLDQIKELLFLDAHTHMSTRANVEASHKVYCCYCQATFTGRQKKKIKWNGDLAFCSKCGVDALLGDDWQFPITSEFIKMMKDYWFSPKE